MMRNRIVLALVVAGCRGDTSVREFRSATGHFRAQFPAAPVESTKKTLALPNMTEVHLFLVERGARGSLQVAYYDLATPLSAELVHDATKLDCSHPFVGSKFQIAGQRPVTLDAVAGVAVTGKAPTSETLPEGGFEEDRCFVASGRMYHVMGIGPDTPETRADIAHFLDSFHLTDLPESKSSTAP